MGILACLWLGTARLAAQSNVTFELVGSWTNPPGGSLPAIKVSQGIAYLGGNTLEVIDVRDPARPTWLASYRPAEGGSLREVEVIGSTAFLALSGGDTRRGGLHVVDVSDPSQPRRLGHSSAPKDATDLCILGDYALVADFYSGLHLLDIRNPATPLAVALCQAIPNPTALDVVGDRAYLADWTLAVIDISDMAHPQLRGSYSDYAQSIWDVKVAGTNAFLGRVGLEVVDVSRPEQLVSLARFVMEDRVTGLVLLDQNLYLAAGRAGLLVYDISKASQPEPVGECLTLGAARHLALADGHAFVVGDRALEIYRLVSRAIGIARQPRSQVFTNNGQALVLEGRGVSVSPLRYQWQKDGRALTDDGRLSGTSGPQLMISDVSPADRGTYSLTVSNEYGLAASLGATVEYQPGLREALDTPDGRWTSAWMWQTNLTHDGVDAAQSPSLQSGIVGMAAGISTRLTGPGSLSFWWRVTAVSDIWTGPDFKLALHVNGDERATTSEEPFRDTGPERWTQVVAEIPEGEQEVQWCLWTLGGCTDPAIGTAWLDEVHFTPQGPSISRIIPGPTNESCRLECLAAPGTRVVLQRSTNLASWEDCAGSSGFVPPNGCIEFDVPRAASGCGFYRLRVGGQ